MKILQKYIEGGSPVKKSEGLTDREVWESNKDGVQEKYGSFEEYQKAAQAWRNRNAKIDVDTTEANEENTSLMPGSTETPGDNTYNEENTSLRKTQRIERKKLKKEQKAERKAHRIKKREGKREWRGGGATWWKKRKNEGGGTQTQEQNVPSAFAGMIAKAAMSSKAGKMEDGGVNPETRDEDRKKKRSWLSKTIDRTKQRYARYKQKKTEKPVDEHQFFTSGPESMYSKEAKIEGALSGFGQNKYGLQADIEGLEATLKNPNLKAVERRNAEKRLELKRQVLAEKSKPEDERQSTRDLYLQQKLKTAQENKRAWLKKKKQWREEDEEARRKRTEGSEKHKQITTMPMPGSMKKKGGMVYDSGGNVKVKLHKDEDKKTIGDTGLALSGDFGVDAKKELDFLKNVDQGVKQEKTITLKRKYPTKKTERLPKRPETRKEGGRGNYRGGSDTPQVIRDKNIVRNRGGKTGGDSSSGRKRMTSADRVERRGSRKEYRRAMRKYRQEMRQYNRTMRRKAREERRENRGMTYTQGRRISPRRWMKNLRDRLGGRYVHEGRAKGYRDFRTSRINKPEKPIKNFNEGGVTNQPPKGYMSKARYDKIMENLSKGVYDEKRADFLRKEASKYRQANASPKMKKHLKFVKDRDEMAKKFESKVTERKIKMPKGSKTATRTLTKQQMRRILMKEGGKQLLKRMVPMITAAEIAYLIATADKEAPLKQLKTRAKTGSYSKGRKI